LKVEVAPSHPTGTTSMVLQPRLKREPLYLNQTQHTNQRNEQTNMKNINTACLLCCRLGLYRQAITRTQNVEPNHTCSNSFLPIQSLSAPSRDAADASVELCRRRSATLTEATRRLLIICLAGRENWSSGSLSANVKNCKNPRRMRCETHVFEKASQKTARRLSRPT